MSNPPIENQVEDKSNDKEYNFRALEAKYKREVEQERQARMELEKRLAESKKGPELEDEDDDDPYVDRKKLKKTLHQFGEQSIQQTRSEIDRAVNSALTKERQAAWMKANGDFYDVMKHADKLAEQDPELAETILAMPDGFERQKLVYKSIKNMSLHQEKPKETIQNKIDQNRRSPFYQPSGSSSAPYQGHSDFSESGQKQAYEKLQQLKKNLRL